MARLVTECTGQSGLGLVPMHMGGNKAAWLSISDFLARENLREVLAARAAATGKRSDGAAARAQALPDGNHGDNRRSIK